MTTEYPTARTPNQWRKKKGLPRVGAKQKRRHPLPAAALKQRDKRRERSRNKHPA